MIEKKTSRYILLLALISLIISPLSAIAATNETFQIPAKAAFAVDYETGKILYNQNGDEALAIASMTKLITAYIVFDEIKNNRLTWEDNVPINDVLKEMSQDPELSNIPLNDEQQFTVKDALYGSLVSSANSLTSALAELISGSENKFVDRMYEQLKSWDIEDASLVSASGLGNEDILSDEHYPGTSKTDENMLSARSMAIIARHLIQDFPEVLEITSQPSVTVLENTDQAETIDNSNEMLKGYDFYKEGVDGLKTGTTPLAGNCFVGTITKDGHRIITVVMNVDEEYNRFEETSKLMDYVFDTWTFTTVAKKGDLASEKELTVSNGKEKTVDLILADDLSLWTNKASDIVYTFESDNNIVNKSQEISAPKSQGTIVGKESAHDENDSLGYLTTKDKNKDTVDVVLKNAIEKENFFMQIWHSIFPRR